MPNILIATDNVEDAKMIKQQVSHDYANVFVSTNPLSAVQDFETHRPDVLVLAFNGLEKAERYYLGLYRISSMVHAHPHRTVILCNKEEIHRVYDLCRKDYFDDYILYWPMTHDVTRLAMSIHHATRSLAAANANPSAAKLAIQARRLAELETLLEWNVAHGGERIDNASRSMARAEQEIGASLNGFSLRLAHGDIADVVEVKDSKKLQDEISRILQEDIHDSLHAAAESVEPLKDWAQEFKQRCNPHLESVRTLKAIAEAVPPVIMVVDDDEMQRKLLGKILAQERYELIFAASGTEALGLLRKRRPDLILMDVMMPDIDGVETTRRLKSAEQFAAIPVIMVTGNSEKALVASCLKAGAVDFVVKPFHRETLLDKIHKFLY